VSKSKEKIAQSIIKGAITLKESLTSASLMLGLSIDPLPTLAEVASLIPSPMGNNIADEVSQLARLKNLIVRENGMAKQFVEKSLELVTESLNILSGADQIKGESYQSDGKKEKGVKKALPSKISREV
jgi:hypothetical protein